MTFMNINFQSFPPY